MKQLIIDTDCGIDDALAITMALTDPRVEVLALTCVSGNVQLQHVLQNVAIVLDAVDAENIPIYAGASRPLLMPAIDASEVHGVDGLGDVGFPPSARGPEKEAAALAIIRLAHENPGAILVPLGPLTNIALALAIEPELPALLGGTVLMGGAAHGSGNASAVAEFNIYADPEAAVMVFERGLRPTVVDWEVTLSRPILWESWDRLMQAGPMGRHVIGPMNAKLCERARARGRYGTLMPDPLAMLVAIEPEAATGYEAHVSVDTGWSAARGMTAVDRRINAAPPNAHIVSAIDQVRFEAMIERACAAACRFGRE